jgi:butyrate kinase
LAAQICDLYAKDYGGAAYIVNPPDVDEYEEIARVSGLSDIFRCSHTHALNQKEIALRYSKSINADYRNINLIVCHIGGGISVTAHKRGRMADGNDIIRGEGPMTPTRAGSLPSMDLLELCFSGKYSEKQLRDRFSKMGGLIDHLGTADAREIEERIAGGDAHAKWIYEAMFYQIAKDIGACAAALQGDVNAILLTGGISNSRYATAFIESYVCWIAPVVVMAGEFEMEALAAGALRVVRGREEARVYTGEPVWIGFGKETEGE